MGIGDWGLGIGPNPQSPIPTKCYYFILKVYFLINNYIINIKIIKLDIIWVKN